MTSAGMRWLGEGRRGERKGVGGYQSRTLIRRSCLAEAVRVSRSNELDVVGDPDAVQDPVAQDLLEEAHAVGRVDLVEKEDYA